MTPSRTPSSEAAASTMRMAFSESSGAAKTTNIPGMDGWRRDTDWTSHSASTPASRFCLLERRTGRGNHDPVFHLEQRVCGQAELLRHHVRRPGARFPDVTTNFGTLVERLIGPDLEESVQSSLLRKADRDQRTPLHPFREGRFPRAGNVREIAISKGVDPHLEVRTHGSRLDHG